DEDREGESISWHLVQVLKPKVPYERLVFHEITKKAISDALNSPRDINENLVRAQEARRILDRLFGYLVSPVLWKKMTRGLSAGRVQSVALRLLVERERERIAFKSANYSNLTALLEKKDFNASFEAQLFSFNGKEIASSKDFNPATGAIKESRKEKVLWLNEESAKEVKASLESSKACPVVTTVEKKPFKINTPAPFITSTLQQEANSKLKFSAKHTMALAQTLYENGFITYMRTDSTTLSEEGLKGARAEIKNLFGEKALPAKPKEYVSKVKNAQEAHEAIRPAGEQFASPKEVTSTLGIEAGKLYELIYKRTLASQMMNAEGESVSAQIKINNALFKVSGRTITKKGFLEAYTIGEEDSKETPSLPPLREGEELNLQEIKVTSHSTQPPYRYTEGSLIRELEKRGIGRPSTWASVVDVVVNRKYAFKRGNSLVPTFLALAVINLMEKNFSQLVDFEFTAKMEDELDAISRGEAEWIDYLKKFYFGNHFAGLQNLIKEGEKEIDPREVCTLNLFSNEENKKNIEIRIGKWGTFLTDGSNTASLPDNIAPDELTYQKAVEILNTAKAQAEPIAREPNTNAPIYLKHGRYGYYLQIGDNQEKESDNKPRIISLLADMKPADVTKETALKLAALPKKLGLNPENGEEIILASGRYGPYIQCGKETRSIKESWQKVLSFTLDDALKLLKEEKKGRSRRRSSSVLKELGVHPVTEKPLQLKTGRYGPYVTDGKINASVPKGFEIENVTLDDAVAWLEEKSAKLAEQALLKEEEEKTTKRKKSKTEKTKKS
ncbi:MAG: type I DNA topoisomerase, partial [Candidatus Dadabacteria bacterium]